MKIAEVVAQFIASQGIKHVFGVSGGACLHLIHGITETTDVRFIPTTHECNAGFAADAYARVAGFGCALATSGPGATNLITAIATSFYDSVPVLYITGNVATYRFGAPLGVRQYGFQETPIVDMVKNVTKYAVTVTEPSRILLALETAVYYAKDGRPGPVLVDIPDDVQRMDVNPEALRRFVPPRPHTYDFDVCPVVEALQQAKRPIFVWGAGMRRYAKEARKLAESLGIPVACTWGAIDLLPHDHPLMAGGFGTHGTRAANFSVQNADLVVALGSRLDTKATSQLPHFARGARVAMVDIDLAEIDKFRKLGREIDFPICADAGEFIYALSKYQSPNFYPVWDDWEAKIFSWRKRYDTPTVDWPGTNPYELMKALSRYIGEDTILCSDTGFALGWMMQAYPFKGERFIHAFNMTPMGYGLPGAIGAAFATGRRIVLVTGDGSLMMSLPELATVSRWGINLKIILLNNQGHGMCRQTQRQWLGGTYPGTSVDGGLGFPHWWRCSGSFGVPISESFEELFSDMMPSFLEIDIHPDAQLIPQAKYGQPIEDADPLLPWEELKEQMTIPPVERT